MLDYVRSLRSQGQEWEDAVMVTRPNDHEAKTHYGEDDDDDGFLDAKAEEQEDLMFMKQGGRFASEKPQIDRDRVSSINFPRQETFGKRKYTQRVSKLEAFERAGIKVSNVSFTED